MTLPFGPIVAALVGAAMLSPAARAQEPAAKRVATVALDPAARDAAAVVDRFHQELSSGDLSAAAGFLDDNTLIYESGGVERGKAEYAAHHLTADAAFSKAVPSVITARAGGAADGLAWVATEGRTKGSYKGKAVDRVSTETMVLRRTAGAWKIVHVHWSSGAAAKP